jgi:hypothetical protein
VPAIDLHVAALKDTLGRDGHGTAYLNFADQRNDPDTLYGADTYLRRAQG